MDEATAPKADAAAPSPAVTESPEFKAAVAQAVATSMVDLRKEFAGMLAKSRKSSGTEAGGDDDHFAEKMAMAIAQLTDQGTGRKRVAPEILQQRAKARDLMVKLIIDAHAAGKVPSYTLRNKVYLDEVLVEPVYITPQHEQKATEIEWPGVPSNAMIPANDIAREIFAAYKESTGTVENAGPGDKPLLAVTASGLVIRSGSRAVQPLQVGNQAQAPTGQGLNIKHKATRPGQHKEVNILGTVAPPARQAV